MGDKVKEKLVENSISGVADAVLGTQVIDHLKEYSLGTTRVPALGVAAELETAIALYGVQAL